jgi:hypothetical protein
MAVPGRAGARVGAYATALHLAHPIDFDFRKNAFVFRGDSGQLAGGEPQVDSRMTIGEITEEELYLPFPADKAARLSDDRHLSIGIDDISFGLPYACRETFLDIRKEIE